jgi:phage regulator Rha-like protein
MNELVILENKEPVTTSLIISEGVKKDHHSVLLLIRNHKESLKEFGTLEFQIQKTKGRPLEFAYLNEQQTTFLITLMRNNEIVIGFKKKLVKEFYKMKKVLSEISTRQTNEEWRELRNTGKITRKKETDTIKEFVEYAISNGSQNAQKYYANISKMENQALFFIEQKFPNLREILTGQQLQIISAADQIVEKAIKEGMQQGMHYKEIYKLAKERIETFASIVPKTIVPMSNKAIE